MDENKTERLFRMYRALLRDGYFYRADCIPNGAPTEANVRAFQRDIDAIKTLLAVTLKREESNRGPRYVIDESIPEDRTLDDLREKTGALPLADDLTLVMARVGRENELDIERETRFYYF